MANRVRNQILSPVGVCVLPRPGANASRTATYPDYIYEIMDASGVFYTQEEFEGLAGRLPSLGVLVTIGEVALPDELSQALTDWVEAGGAWISVAGVCGLHGLFGVEAAPAGFSMFGGGVANLGEGYLKPDQPGHPALSHLEIPLHYYNGTPLLKTDASVLAHGLDAHGRETERVVLTEKAAGAGLAICIAVDITGSVVIIQQGRGAVTRDGIPAPDSTGPICDEVLKSGDGGALDWLFDREPVPGVPGSAAFLQPIADQWRELLLRTIFYAANRQGVEVPVLWLYPRNQPAIAHISLDTDGNEPAHADILFNTLEEQGVKATWCTIMPGLPQPFMLKIQEHGHELAMHYDSMTDGLNWGRDQFSLQWRGLVDLFNGHQPVTNKNHYLRWEGDTELWEWCVAHQIQLDQTKGASKTGEAGFNFGTCRPYFPVDFRGNYFDVLELPTYTQDMEIFAPTALFYALLKPVVKHHGVLHLLFHPAHTHKPATNKALREVTDKGREAGLEWWTAEQINNWERARRMVKWEGYSADDAGTRVKLQSASPLPEATILWMGAPAAAGDTGARWGFESRVETVNVGSEAWETSSAEVAKA